MTVGYRDGKLAFYLARSRTSCTQSRSS